MNARSLSKRAKPARGAASERRFFLGITGGSGHAYALALARALLDGGHALDVCVTRAGVKVLRHELGLALEADGANTDACLRAELGVARGDARVRVYEPDAIEAPPSSGTALTGAVILCPCSMGTLARVSAGFSSNLVERAADVALKEGRRLVLVPREAPYSAIHLENMLRMARLGAVVLPASPGFYHRPRTIEDLVDHVVGKILDRVGVAHALTARWSGTREVGAADAAEPPAEEGVEPREPAADRRRARARVPRSSSAGATSKSKSTWTATSDSRAAASSRASARGRNSR